MNIVIICDYGSIHGGDSKVAITSAVALNQLGHNVLYFTAVSPIDPKLRDSKIKAISTNQNDILSEPNRIQASIQGIRNFKAERLLKQTLNTLDPKDTIIHIHSVAKAISPSIYKIIYEANFKFITTLHDYFLACPNGSFYNYGKKQICEIEPLSLKCLFENCDSRNYGHKIWRYVRTIIQRDYYRIPEKIPYFIAISELSKKVLKKYLPQNSKIFRLDNPIDIKKTQRIPIQDSSVFLYVGRLSPEKGVEILLKNSNYLTKDLMIVGNGPMFSDLKKRYKKVVFTGWKNKEEVNKIMKNARAVIYPSFWYEVQPLVVLESLAQGIPVVVPDTSASKELIIDGETGLLFKGGDKEDLLKKMKQLENTAFANKLGENAYNLYWKNPFSIERHVKKLINIYKYILKN